MKAGTLTWLIVLGAATLFSGVAEAHERISKSDRLIHELLTARDDDDREDAAKKLGKIGNEDALEALDYAGKHDGNRGVRQDARRAAKKIRARLLAAELARRPVRKVVVRRPAKTVIVYEPVETVVVRRPRVVYRTVPWCGTGARVRMGRHRGYRRGGDYVSVRYRQGRRRHSGLSIGFGLSF